jgi:hypothetical protein
MWRIRLCALYCVATLMRRMLGIERVGQSEIDDAAFAAEIYRRLGADLGEFLQARTAAPGQHIGHGRTHKRGSADGLLAHGSLPQID